MQVFRDKFDVIKILIDNTFCSRKYKGRTTIIRIIIIKNKIIYLLIPGVQRVVYDSKMYNREYRRFEGTVGKGRRWARLRSTNPVWFEIPCPLHL